MAPIMIEQIASLAKTFASTSPSNRIGHDTQASTHNAARLFPSLQLRNVSIPDLVSLHIHKKRDFTAVWNEKRYRILIILGIVCFSILIINAVIEDMNTRRRTKNDVESVGGLHQHTPIISSQNSEHDEQQHQIEDSNASPIARPQPTYGGKCLGCWAQSGVGASARTRLQRTHSNQIQSTNNRASTKGKGTTGESSDVSNQDRPNAMLSMQSDLTDDRDELQSPPPVYSVLQPNNGV